LLFNADARLCRRLIQEILPELRLLDPACGSGNLLVALHQRLTEIFSILTGYIQQTQDTQLQIWRDGLATDPAAGSTAGSTETAASIPPNLIQNLQKRILKHNLYGVDLAVSAAETTRFQLLLHIVATAQHPQDIEPLVDLAFNIRDGNSLIGFITVDEERFDQVNKASAGSVLQGDLLQPLAANGYQNILTEKNLIFEHYKSRNQLLARARIIPEYARTALLREEIFNLDTVAQNKLDTLLLSHMSQQLGIQYKAAQLTDKPQRRSLTLEDIDVLQPFHWGYHFNAIIKKGGFDVVVCAPPWGAFKPTADEFLQTFQDLAAAKGVSVRSLKTSKAALIKGDPEVTQAWLFYQDQYAYVADYFYRSEHYAHQNPTDNGKLIRNQLKRERLFVERCFNLLSPNGIGALLLPDKLLEDEKARTLAHFLQAQAKITELNRDERNTAIVIWEMKDGTKSTKRDMSL
ncbi:MAG: DNA methyltransferase, partial [Phormidesmis sp.]